MVAYRSQDNSWSRHMSPEKVVGAGCFHQPLRQGQDGSGAVRA